MRGKQRLWQMTQAQYDKHRDRQFQRSIRAAGFGSTSDYSYKHRRRSSLWQRLDKVRDPKSAFFYLLDNVAGRNGGKMLSDFHSHGKYYWHERNRERDQAYYFVQRKGNHIVVTRTRYVIDGEGINTFIGGLIHQDKEPTVVRETILRHPIMQVTTFLAAYKAAAPELGWYADDE